MSLKSLGEKNPYRYRGYRYDNETGYYYLQSRYYNPEWGRFLNADGLVSTGQGMLSHNMFSYCLNNPASNKDDNGFLCSSITDGATTKEFEGYYTKTVSSVSVASNSKDIIDGVTERGNRSIIKTRKRPTIHSGQVRIHDKGMTDVYMTKSKYLGYSIKQAAKSSIIPAAIVSGVSNFSKYDDINSEFVIGWAVDTLTAVAVNVLATGLVVGFTLAITTATVPLTVTALATIGVATMIAPAFEKPAAILKEWLN